MNEYIPDKWVVVKIEGEEFPLTYKVFGCWYGGYLGSNSWKMNSGIKFVSAEDNCYLFEGYSGSIYKCYKRNYGTHMYGQGVLEDIIERSKEARVTIKTMPKNTNWLELTYE
jgi:hypothetical protein